MSKEHDCKWVFGPQDPTMRKGPNNATTMAFKDEDFHSLIRESIQNSLDAIDDKTKPVVVSFARRQFTGTEYPNFFSLKDHIEGCLTRFPDNDNAKKKYGPMLDYFKGNKFEQSIGYLRITDSNTTGMSYDPTTDKTGFFAFISEGIANKDESAGGAFGFGKDAFWALSPISTVFVTSKTENQVNFAGIAKLCTNIIGGTEYAPYGRYSQDDQMVISEESKIPEDFKQGEKGTSVFVLGVEAIDEEAMIKSVLRNFWMAIYESKLEVYVEKKKISKDTLAELMEKYFPEEDNNVSESYNYNPRPFYDIVVKASSGEEGFKLISQNIQLNRKDANVKLYLHAGAELEGHAVFMRAPLMIVKTEIKKSFHGKCVFICDDPEGNKFLREMEDYTHSSWTKNNFKARNNSPLVLADEANNAIFEFIVNSLRAELNEEANETAKPAGLENILSMAEPKEKNGESKKDDIIDLDNVPDKNINKSKPSNSGRNKVQRTKRTNTIFDENGRLLSNRGTRRKKKAEKKGKMAPGNRKGKNSESKEGVDSIVSEAVDVSYRTWIEVEDKKVWHVVKIFSPTDIENAYIQIFGVKDDERPYGLNICETTLGTICSGEDFMDSDDYDDRDDESTGKEKHVNNALKGIELKSGIPTVIKVRFNSDIKYSLRINSDKILKDEE